MWAEIQHVSPRGTKLRLVGRTPRHLAGKSHPAKRPHPQPLTRGAGAAPTWAGEEPPSPPGGTLGRTPGVPGGRTSPAAHARLPAPPLKWEEKARFPLKSSLSLFPCRRSQRVVRWSCGSREGAVPNEGPAVPSCAALGTSLPLAQGGLLSPGLVAASGTSEAAKMNPSI